MPAHPGAAAAGSNANFQSQALGVLKISMDAGKYRQQKVQLGKTSTAPRAYGVTINRDASQLLQVRVEIEMAVGSADTIDVNIQPQLTAVSGVQFLPSLELGAFSVQDQAVEIENQRVNVHGLDPNPTNQSLPRPNFSFPLMGD